MNLRTDSLPAAFALLASWEALAVALAIAYLVLAIRQSPWCWPAAIGSTGIYVFVMAGAGLYMESALQLFYIAMAVYGWYCWRKGTDGTLRVTTWPLRQHLMAICTVLILAALSGYLLEALTRAAFPYVDSFTSWGAVVTTYMVARKILENWIYWFVIDGLSIWLYVGRGLYLTAVLFGFYLVLIVIGYFAWRKSLREATA